MKDKMERFNQDDELRLAAYNRELNIYAHKMELEESYQKGIEKGEKDGKKKGIEEGIEIGKEEGKKEGIEEGILFEKKNLTIQLFKSKYPDEDDNLLSNLEAKEYDMIFKMLLEDQSLKKIKEVIKK